MGLAEEIARVRLKARGADINARHRRARERARLIESRMAPVTPPNGVSTEFEGTLAEARERARRTVEQAESKPKTPQERIEQLVREGKLPPRTGDGGVGYEPTADEILGDLGEYTGETADLPDAASVLSSDPVAPSERWGEAPGATAAAAPPGGALMPETAPPLAPSPPVVQGKRKRGK